MERSHLPQLLSSIAASLGGFIVGNVLGYASPATFQLQEPDEGESPTTDVFGHDLALSSVEISWFSSIFNIGALLGGLISVKMMKRIGGRASMLLAAAVALAGWLLIGLGVNFWMLLAGRLLTGVYTGLACVACNMYIAQVTSKEIRGLSVSIFQIMFGVGILFSIALGGALPWYALALVCAGVPLLFGALMFLNVETPSFLLANGKPDDALRILQILRGNGQDVSEEFMAMSRAQYELSEHEWRWSHLRRYEVWAPFVIVLLLMVGQQICGVNAVLFNLNSIFDSAGSHMSEYVSSVICGSARAGSTLVATLLVERLGRKLLLLASTSLMTLSLGTLGLFFYASSVDTEWTLQHLGWLPTTSVVVFFFAFSTGIAPVPYILMSELLPANFREVGSGVATALNWTASFLVVISFNPLTEALPEYGFWWLFAGINLAMTVLFFVIVTETKGKTFEEIACIYRRSSIGSIESREAKKSGGAEGKGGSTVASTVGGAVKSCRTSIRRSLRKSSGGGSQVYIISDDALGRDPPAMDE